MAKSKESKNAYEYTDWLFNTNRITIEEHFKLSKFLFQLEQEAIKNDSYGCGNCDGCEQSYGCEYPAEGC